MSRKEAEKRLFEKGNQCGSFLVRQSETILGGYTLSVRDQEKVRHYKIKHEQRGVFHYFVTEKFIFKSIADLISHYQSQPGGLSISLVRPCVSSQKPPTAGLSKQANDKWDIDRSQLRPLNKVETGTFAEIYGGLWNDKVPIAIKALKTGVMTVSKLLQEVADLRKIRHPKVVQVYAVCTKEEPFYIITELVAHGSLLGYLRTTEGRSLKIHQLIDVALQVAEGMAYLEEHDYVHRSLSARKVLVGDCLTCKVADFSLSCIISDDKSKSNVGASFLIRWTAPESALNNTFSIKSDVWSFGILLFEIITYGRSPYPGLSNEDVLEKLKQGYRMPQPEDCSYMYYNIMLKCWREEPENRPTFEALLWELEEFLESTGS